MKKSGAKVTTLPDKPAVVLSFKLNGDDYRLVWIPKAGKASSSAAHGVVEIRHLDALGETSWRHVRNFYPPPAESRDDDTLREIIFHKLLDRVRRGRA